MTSSQRPEGRTCPQCGAQPGQPCRRPNGDRYVGYYGEARFHAKRKEARVMSPQCEHDWISAESFLARTFRFCSKCDREEWADGTVRPGRSES